MDIQDGGTDDSFEILSNICFFPCAIGLQSLTIFFYLWNVWNSIVKLFPSFIVAMGLQCLSQKQTREKPAPGSKCVISIRFQLNFSSTLLKLPYILLKLPSDWEDHRSIDIEK